MRKIAFLTKIFWDDKATDEEIVKFMIKNYFLKRETLEDFQDDLVFKYNRGNIYARGLKKRFEDALQKYCR